MRCCAFTTLALASTILSACGSPPGVIFEPTDTVHLWPPPPQQPHIRYLGQLKTSADLKPGRSTSQAIQDTLFGQAKPNAMISPMAVCTDSSNRVFVADPQSKAIHVFDLDSRQYEQWKPPTDAPQFQSPIALTWSPANELYVSDSSARSIFVFDSNGTLSRTIQSPIMLRPVGIAYDPHSNFLYVADPGSHKVFVFSPSGSIIRYLGSRGSEPGQFNFPTQLALDDLGNLYVSDSLNFRIQVFDPQLNPILQVGKKGDSPGYFSQPKGIAIDSLGNLLVVDAHFEAVQLFDPQGTLLMTFGQEGRGPGQFWLPAGIHVDSKGRIWIADSYNGRVQVFEPISDGAVK